MSEQSLLPISVRPVISYPREAEVGKTYLMTIDLQVVEGSEWQFEEEEYPIYCMVDSEPLFSCEAVGEPEIVLHRFGETYGGARFLLTASPQEVVGEARLIFINKWGVPIKSVLIDSVRISQKLNHTAEVTDEFGDRGSDLRGSRKTTISHGDDVTLGTDIADSPRIERLINKLIEELIENPDQADR